MLLPPVIFHVAQVWAPRIFQTPPASTWYPKKEAKVRSRRVCHCQWETKVPGSYENQQPAACWPNSYGTHTSDISQHTYLRRYRCSAPLSQQCVSPSPLWTAGWCWLPALLTVRPSQCTLCARWRGSGASKWNICCLLLTSSLRMQLGIWSRTCIWT